MRLDQGFREREAKTGALMSAAEGAVNLSEWLHHVEYVFLSNADPRIDDFDRKPRPLHLMSGQRYAATIGGELDRIRNQVEQDLPHPSCIALQR